MLFGITDTAFNWFDRDSFVDAAHLQLGRNCLRNGGYG